MPDDKDLIIEVLHRRINQLIADNVALFDTVMLASNDLPEWSRRYEMKHGHREKVTPHA